ncbi:hypothetical protein AYI70_g10705 [Smittium culicis]|uniref:Uncharacterized protein n=1 Tax=Smittium culicis TaxID=133412 RepID=A0A1R1X3D9_9FUNG|nr:hypothetical protein AYI70_g11096 [Smittium culicis]OMJ09828.1 hypothetical protein AYI70_g10705 [Smittium culicis]
MGSVSFTKYLSEMMNNIDGLVLIEINGPNKEVLYKLENSGLQEHMLESVLVNQAYDIFDDISKLHNSGSPADTAASPNIITATFGAMQIVQFQILSFYGFIVADSFSNTGQIIELVKSISNALSLLSDLQADFSLENSKNRVAISK